MRYLPLLFALFVITGCNVPKEPIALNHYVGTWDSRITVRGKQLDGSIVATWETLPSGNRFVKQWSQYDVEGEINKIGTVMIYDETKNEYRMIQFSSGTISYSASTWDSKSKTMVSQEVDPDGKTVQTITSTFPQDGIEHWKVNMFKDGEPYGEIVGENTRKKE